MAEIINLNQVRKAKAKAAAVAGAAENRVRFGRSKAERAGAAGEDKLAAKRIDGHRLEPVAPKTAAPKTDDDPAEPA
jgi:hypothetical protein